MSKHSSCLQVVKGNNRTKTRIGTGHQESLTPVKQNHQPESKYERMMTRKEGRKGERREGKGREGGRTKHIANMMFD